MATIRRLCPCRYCAGDFRVQITDVKRPKTEFEDGTREFAVSSVDLLLPDAEVFIQNNNVSGYAGHTIVGGNLNKHGLWEAFVSGLESTCLCKQERSTKMGRKGVIEVVYTVPIVGFQQFLPASVEDDHVPGAYHGYGTGCADGYGGLGKAMKMKIKRNPAMFAYWMGRYYDTGLIYQYQPERSAHLKAVGSLHAPLPRLDNGATEFTKGMSLRTYRRASLPGRARICHSDAESAQQVGRNYCQADPLDYLEINLGYPRHVTHIGTAGGYPELTTFPKRQSVGRRRMRAYNAIEQFEDGPLMSAKGNGIQRRKFSAYVRILKEEGELSWVTSYEVHYRHPVTHKWTLLLVAPGNTDALTEAVLDLGPHSNSHEGLFTQALRIRPLAHHGPLPLMRVSVYGHDPQRPSQPSPSGPLALRAEEQGGEGELGTAALAVQDLPTIEYTLVSSRSAAERRFVRDGTQRRSTYDDYYYGCGDLKFNKKKGWQAIIREETDSFYYDGET